MANSRAVSLRIPDELLEKIDRLANEKYKSHRGTPNRSLVVLDAIVNYFSTMSDSVESIEVMAASDITDRRLEALENKFIALSDTVSIIVNDRLPKQLDILPERVESKPQKKPEVGKKSIDSKDVTDRVNILNAKQLEERLGIKRWGVGKMKYNYKNDPDRFREWSKSKDPDGYEWEFRSGSSLYYRVGYSEPLA
jgi:predicted transcriptional regulator